MSKVFLGTFFSKKVPAFLPSFPRRRERDFREIVFHPVQLPGVAHQVYGGAFAVFAHGAAVLFDEGFQAGLVFGEDPAGGLKGGGFEGDGDGVFLFDAAGEDVELQHADDTNDPVGAGGRAEDLGDAFFGEIFEGFAHLFGAHGVGEADAAENFRSEVWDAGEAEGFAFGERVTNAQGAVVGDADDVAGKGFLGERAVLREEEDGGLDGHGFFGAGVDEFHAAGEFAGADSCEGDAVAVLGVHVGLDFEDEAGDGGFFGVNGAGFGGAGLGGGGVGDQAFEEFADGIVL